MFFIATADAEGRPQCSYKGGEPGLRPRPRRADDRVPALRRERDVPDRRQRARQPARRAPLHRLRAAPAAAAERRRLGRGRRPAARRVSRRRSSSSGSRRPRSSRTARATSTSTGSSGGRGSSRARSAGRRCPPGRRATGRNDVLPASDPAHDPGRRDRRAVVPRVFASRRFPDRVRAELERSFELDAPRLESGRRARDELLARRRRARTG